jgi:serine protease
VDANLQRSVFSQYNEMVDIAAPGSSILSTFPSNLTNAALIQGTANAYSASMIYGSPMPASDDIKGELVFCRDYGKDTCDGPGDHICLIQRGETSFEVKVASCESSGGIAAIIYNNIPNILLVGSLNKTNNARVPVFGMTAEDATRVYMESYGRNITVQAMEGYAIMDGTSMSTPFIS